MMMLTPDILILILIKLQTLVKKFKHHNHPESQRLISKAKTNHRVIGSSQLSHHIKEIGTRILVINGDHLIPAIILGKMRVKLLLLKGFKILKFQVFY